MSIHDWTRVSDGIFHDFHCGWIVELRNVLNREILPSGYYATAEQRSADVIPDVLTFERASKIRPSEPQAGRGLVAVADAPPQATHQVAASHFPYHVRQRSLVIRFSGDGEVVAIIEIVSPGNKSTRHAFDSLVNKTVSALARGIHVLLIDLHPPGRFDPQGLHEAIWSEIEPDGWTPPADRPLTVASYAGGATPRAWVHALAVGNDLPSPPLFLTQDAYVSIPLESTYEASYSGLAEPYREALESSGSPDNGHSP